MSQPLTSKEFSEQFVAQVKDMREHPEKYKGWKTGIRDLDDLIGGILKRRFYIVGGKQKGGKSSFCSTIAIELNKQGCKVLNISLEMDNYEVACRVFSNIGSIDLNKFRDITLNDVDMVYLENAASRVSSFPGLWDYGTGSLKDIVPMINEYEPDVVIIDYFQLMEVDISKNRAESLANLSRKLKGLTLRKDAHPVTIIVPSQINRASIRAGLMDANSFLDTGSLERDCDVALVIDDLKDEAGEIIPNRKKIKVVASRVSGIGDIDVYFNGSRSLMSGIISDQTDVRNAWYNLR